MTPIRAASECARRGWPVFPAGPDKAPLTPHGFKDASTDKATILQWWQQWPDALLCISTGDARLLVIDVDPDGAEWMHEHYADLGCGYISHTRRAGGRHLYYRLPEGIDIRCSAGQLAPGVDVRAIGGYVVAWWAHGRTVVGELDDIGPPPDWLLERLRSANGSASDFAFEPAVGNRNTYLHRFASSLRGAGMDAAGIRAAVMARNAELDDPLPEREIERTILRSVMRYEAPAQTEAAITGASAPAVICAASIKPRALDPIWPGVLWGGKPTLLVGDPGEGKSMVTCDIAARVTTGAPWPCATERRQPASVMMLSAEDNYADTIVPRLQAAGAELSRVHFLDGIRTPTEDGERRESLYLDQHMAQLDAALAAHRPRVLIVDPLSAYMGRERDQNNEGAVRTVLAALADLATKHSCAVLAVRHFRKGGADTAKGRIIGSVAFVAAARAAYIVARDPDDEDQRLLLCAKCNLAADTDGYRFRIDVNELGTPFVTWDTERETRAADEVLGTRTTDEGGTKEAAAAWLKRILVHGRQPSRDIYRRAKEECGASGRTLNRAKRDLGIKSRKDGDTWYWELSPYMLATLQSSLKPNGGAGFSKIANIASETEGSPDKVDSDWRDEGELPW